MELEQIISKVLPEGSFLYKHNHGLFSLYMDEEDYANGIEATSQEGNESLQEFLIRAIRLIVEDEYINDKEPIVSTDWSLAGGKPFEIMNNPIDNKD